MKIVIAPQAFKGGLRALEAARAMEEGVRRVFPDAETVLVPVADGGDGTLEVLVGEYVSFQPPQAEGRGMMPPTSGGGRVAPRLFYATVTGPLGDPVHATWGVMGDACTAVIEMARASGLALVPEARRDPLRATSYGTGQLVRAAVDAGYREIIVGLGGSATNDGGAGIAQALGARLMAAGGKELPPGGAALAYLERIDLHGLDPRLRECRIRAATDVTNPICGHEGASVVYGPQKGATPAMVKELDTALRRFAHVIQRDMGIDVLALPRAGAAGGAGAGLVALLGAELDSGGEIVCQAVGLDGHLEGAGLVITGEGRLDWQTVYDKAPMVVARHAMARGVPVIMVAGALGQGYEAVLAEGVAVVEAAAPSSMPLGEALARACELVAQAAERAVRRFGQAQ